MEKLVIDEEKDKINLEDVLKNILTNNVNISNEQYTKLLDAVAENYDKNNDVKEGETKPTLEERRERIKANYYGSSINFLFQILDTVNNFYRNYAPLIEAIAEKVGVEFEKVETAEEKAMKEAEKFLREGALKRKAERELLEKQNLNREARRKLQKKTGEKIKFEQ